MLKKRKRRNVERIRRRKRRHQVKERAFKLQVPLKKLTVRRKFQVVLVVITMIRT